ncbi:unnamed protein product, partial [Oppiella nova]
MDTKRLSLNHHLHEHMDTIRSSASFKIFRRYVFYRQIVKCINECKAQAGQAKKFVENIKDNSKQRGTDRTDVEGDDFDGWGSDFDSDENDDSEDLKSKTSLIGNNLKQNSEDLLYEPVSDYMSDGSFTRLDAQLTDTETNTLQTQTDNHEPIGHVVHNSNTLTSDNVESHDINRENTQFNGNGGTEGGSASPKPSPRLMPKPPTTKPEVPKNKPQIIPRKPFTNNSVKTAPNPQIKRPPSEPPPPPLPKSPPPVSPVVIPSDLNLIFNESSGYSLNSQNISEDTYESIVLPLTEDEYLSPISVEIPALREQNKSFAAKTQFLSSQSLNHCFADDYQSFREISKSVEQIHQLDTTEENYEIVNDCQELNGNQLSANQRPLLPKVKEPPVVPKSNPISDVFSNIPNWSRSSKEKKTGRPESDTNLDDHSLRSQSLEFINHNNSLGNYR